MVPTKAARTPFTKASAAALAGLLLPLSLALCWEKFRCHVADPWQVARATDLHVLCEIARIPAGAMEGKSLSRGSIRDDELYRESVDHLRTSLVVNDAERELQVLAVASAVSREGKTSLATELALSFVRSGESSVILVDGDLRAPDVHRLMQVDDAPGLAEFLDRQATLDEVVKTTPTVGLHVLPAGKSQRSPHALLAPSVVECLFRQLRERYRHIIVDAPPLLPAAEAIVLASAADATILCALLGRTRETQLRLAMERLRASGVKPLGAVLAGASARTYAYRYGDYYARADNDINSTQVDVPVNRSSRTVRC
jgi:capsular exopolysaccharide synthesis family protein